MKLLQSLVLGAALALSSFVAPAPVEAAKLVKGFRPVPPDGELWSQTATWGGTVPVNGQDVLIPAGKKVLIDTDTASLRKLTIEGTVEFMTAAITTLTAQGIHIKDGGKLVAGTQAAPHVGFTVTLNGVKQPATITGMSHNNQQVSAGNPNDAWDGVAGLSRGIVIEAGGEVELNAALPSPVLRTNLGNHMADGATTGTLATAVTWAASQQVLVGPTDFYNNQKTTVATLTTAINAGTTMTISPGVVGFRWGKQQYLTDSGISLTQGTFSTMKASAGMSDVYDQRAKVGLLTRKGVIQAPLDSEFASNRFGAHIMIMGLSSKFVLRGVELRRVGQGGLLGRYPIHWHMLSYNPTTGENLGNVDPTRHIVENSVIHQSWNRGFTIHGTRGVIIRNNISHDVKGHNLFLEDGSEEENVIEGNWFSGARDPQEGVTNDPVTVTVGTPGIFNRTNHGYTNGTCLGFYGPVPGGFSTGSGTAGVFYWVVNATANTFQLASIPNGAGIQATSPGTSVTITRIWSIKHHDQRFGESGASGAWITNGFNTIKNNSAFDNVGRGWWNAFQYSKKFKTGTAGGLVVAGTPITVNWTAHGVTAGTSFIYSTTATPAGGLTNGQVVYAIATGMTADSFQIAATYDGTALAGSGNGSGSHYLMSSGCFGPSSNVPIIPFFKAPLEVGGVAMYSGNEGHSNGTTGAVLNFAAGNERGTIFDGSTNTALSLPGHGSPRFTLEGHTGGTLQLGRFHGFFLWKNQEGGYQNRVENVWYEAWTQGDNLGTFFFGSTKEGVGAKLTDTIVVAESLNLTTAPAGMPNVVNAFASYHSSLDFINITAYNFSHTTPVVASTNFPYSAYALLFARGVMQFWDFYTNPVEMGSGRHINWKMFNSVGYYKTPPPHLINDLWDTWTNNQAMDCCVGGTNHRRWTIGGAQYDHNGAFTGIPGVYVTWNHPFFTAPLGASFTADTPASMMSGTTPTHMYGLKPKGDDTQDVDPTSGNYTIPITFQHLDSSLNPIAGAVWDLPDSSTSEFFDGNKHAAVPRGSYVRYTNSRGIQSQLIHIDMYNVSRKAGVAGFTEDDFFYLILDWNGAVAPVVFATVSYTGTFPNYSYDPSWVGQGRAVAYTSVASLADLQAAAPLTYWRDAPNNRLVVKIGSHHHNWSFWGTGTPNTSPRIFDFFVTD